MRLFACVLPVLVACGAPSDDTRPPQPASIIAADPVAIDFGGASLGQPVNAQVTLTNTGKGDLEIGNISFETEPTPFTIETPSDEWFVILPTGLSTTLDLQFTPTERGIAKARLRVRSNDPARPEIFATLIGEGLEGDLELLQRSLDLGPVAVDASATGEIWFSNAGTDTLFIESATVPAGPWEVLAPPPATLGPGDSSFIGVSFQPREAGPAPATLTLTAEGATREIRLAGSGEIVPVEDPVRVDDDGDGWTTEEGDCDDADPVRHPFATTCGEDSEDLDCDGIPDETTDRCCNFECGPTGFPNPSLTCETTTPDCFVEATTDSACGMRSSFTRCVFPDGLWYAMDTDVHYDSECDTLQIRTSGLSFRGGTCTWVSP